MNPVVCVCVRIIVFFFCYIFFGALESWKFNNNNQLLWFCFTWVPFYVLSGCTLVDYRYFNENSLRFQINYLTLSLTLTEKLVHSFLHHHHHHCFLRVCWLLRKKCYLKCHSCYPSMQYDDHHYHRSASYFKSRLQHNHQQ